MEPQEEDAAICAVSTVAQKWVAPPLHVEGGIFQPYDFLTSESLGTDLPRRCTSCRKCKECKFRTDSLTFKEDQEYQVILEGLEFNKERRKWRATYPFHIPPTTLKDNYQQVYKYTLAQEKRLAKQGRTEEFNAEFYKTVERGVLKEITKEEMDAWDSPVNYISMVEAFKEGPHSTTPLRICMNSSLKQPYPVSLSLNDCLIKGPSALVDLFTVTLCIREHRYALKKDLSKFYQRVDADPIAQNLRRVMWRGGDTSAEMKVYITMTVNFGDKPAGYIAIAAARETAAMDEGEFREAAWFLQNRTYVDDATAGADSMERLEALSKEMEAVAKRGGFEFKETLMSGDKEDENGEPHKVLGLIWETEADRLKVDVKLNLGAKKANLHLMENIELNEGSPEGLRLGRPCASEHQQGVPRGSYSLGGAASHHIPEGCKTQRRSGGQAYAADIRRRIDVGQLRIGLPAMADGRRYGPVPTTRRQDQGGTEVQDLHPEDGIGGGTPGREAGTEDPGLTADGIGGGEVLHRLGSRVGDDPQGIGNLPGVRRYKGERDPDQIRS
jgi:hypothetical protein